MKVAESTSQPYVAMSPALLEGRADLPRARVEPGAQTLQSLAGKVQQLPLVWKRKEGVTPAFRAYTADVLYDLQVYRALFDDADRQLAREPEAVRRQVQERVLAAEYPRFAEFLDQKLLELERETETFTRQQHELHGFFFRKELWDIIMSSELMARTNLKPRGYAGDSMMMHMLYDREARGPTTFARMMHRHPIEQPAAQAVRNRRDLVAARIQNARDAVDATPARPLRVLSVACGPASEIAVVLRATRTANDLDLVLLDQDPEALDEARKNLVAAGTEIGEPVRAHYVRGSVRTLQQSAAELVRSGTFDLVYSMGLFDYLTPPVAKQVLRGLFDLTAPGGALVIGNFHPRNPNRLYMEYWLDWVLFYRDEFELRDLAAEVPAAEPETFFESTGVQGFLVVSR